ncbi:hypothetical protein OG948_60555 (plasmid) [Embleya sp. NBC_00888]|uniref:hypothetical protein n=1 Tax=Embleya sp. NBC_00888 TaxID=2975960 RepID=UPI002F90F358|nr:hypothetical protein OG948_60555 [Embleya sp. NBC_00888]
MFVEDRDIRFARVQDAVLSVWDPSYSHNDPAVALGTLAALALEARPDARTGILRLEPESVIRYLARV